jgi:hypothetical protein
MKWLGPIALVICVGLLGLAIAARQDKQEMDDQIQSTLDTRAIPAIDAAAPEHYSTATFAAG